MKGSPHHFLREENFYQRRGSYENGWSKKSATPTWDILSYQAEINLQMTQKATDQLEAICMQIVSMNRVRIEVEVVRCGKDADE